MNITGLLIAVRKYEFPDKETGEIIRGAKVILGVEPDDRQGQDMTGLVVQDVSAQFDTYGTLATQGKGLVGQNVTLECEVTLRGKYTKLRALAIRKALSAAA